MNLIGLFLEEMVITSDQSLVGSFFLFFAGMMLLVGIIISIAVYVYMSLAYMGIAKKANHPSPGIAWIPGIGPALISAKIAEMHWWPILFLIGLIIPVIGPFLMIPYIVFMIIWTWKLYEKFGKPGWWAILIVIPIANIFYFISIGMIAWGESKYQGPIPNKV